MDQWLLHRLFDPDSRQNPEFAFRGTVNWMRALSLLVDNGSFDSTKIQDHYKSVNRRKLNQKADTLVCENMMMAFHNQASLERLCKDTEHPYDVCRSAIVSWYYSIYFTCSAMIAATSGASQETHAKTAKVWQSGIVDHNLVLSPFSLSLSSLVKDDVENGIKKYRGENKYHLSHTYAENHDQAWGAVVSYLSGTCDYEKDKAEKEIKASKDFKDLRVADFRKKAARELRDKQLAKYRVNYLTQAFRYRGKANYRDSIFLSYGNDDSEKVVKFIQDLNKVSYAFQRMAACYLYRRIEQECWSDFITDLSTNSRLDLDPKYLNN